MLEKLKERIANLLFYRVAEATRDPAQTLIKRIGYAFVKSGGGGNSRQNFEAPAFNFDTLTSAYDTDSYIHQAIDKYVDLIFKAGWTLKGKNQKSLDYVKLRLSVMAESTNTNTNALLTEIADSVVKYGNSFVIKARLKQSMNVPGLTVTGIQGLQPIGGYFSLAPSTIQIARDANGTVLQYQQKVAGQNKPFLIKPQDMVHITWKKPIGQGFGNPFLLPVLDDIRLLREIEDNVSNLLYKYLHPLYKFIIGLQKDGQESTAEEIQRVRELVQEMPMDGTLVLPERYDVEVVGAEGSALDASWALKYFEQRVFTGLGVPETVFGRASTSNKATADNLTAEMHDRIKAFQRVIADEIWFQMIKELLLEGGFDVLVKPEDDVRFEFNEIAVDEQIKKENQAIFIWEHNAGSFEEMRLRMGMDPVIDESRLYLNMIKIPEIEATAAATAANSPTATGTPSANNKAKPTNQHGTKLSPKAKPSKTAASVEESISLKSNEDLKSKLSFGMTGLKADVLEAIKDPNNQDMIGVLLNAYKESMKKDCTLYVDSAFSNGVTNCKKDCKVNRTPANLSSQSRQIKSKIEDDIDRFFSSLQVLLSKAVQTNDQTAKKILVSNSFEAIKYRLDFIANSQLSRAYNYGYAVAAKAFGRTELDIIKNDNCCEECSSKNSVSLGAANLIGSVPPWHPNDSCYVKVKR